MWPWRTCTAWSMMTSTFFFGCRPLVQGNLLSLITARLGGECRKEVTFLYKLRDGSCPKSYGMHVANMAGVPEEVSAAAAAAVVVFCCYCHGCCVCLVVRGCDGCVFVVWDDTWVLMGWG